MALRSVRAAIAVILLASSARAQLPPNQRLSVEDQREFTKELEWLETLLPTANDKGAIELQIANTYAAGGQFSEALRWLRKVVGANLGFDPSRDPDFAKLQPTAEFRSIVDEVRRQTPPVHNSRLITTLGARGVRPESIAFDASRKAFVLGNTSRSELIECSLRGNCHTFVMPKAGERDYVLGIKIDSVRGEVWATDNATSAASLRCYDLETGKLQRSVSIQGKHVFNDLTISSTGTVYVSDTAEGSVYQVPSGTTTLQRIAPQHKFTAANGIAISTNGTLLYVSTWGDGIDVIELLSGAVMPMIHPHDVSLAFIDGLYAIQGSLIAIQNGPMLPRIVEFGLSKSQRQIIAMKVLERRNPAFDGITTGVIVRNNLYYVANPQTDKKGDADLRPLQVFSVRIDR
jgi:hypothetical protein